MEKSNSSFLDLTFCIQALVCSYIALLGCWTPLIKEYKITPSLHAVPPATAWSRLNTAAPLPHTFVHHWTPLSELKFCTILAVQIFHCSQSWRLKTSCMSDIWRRTSFVLEFLVLLWFVIRLFKTIFPAFVLLWNCAHTALKLHCTLFSARNFTAHAAAHSLSWLLTWICTAHLPPPVNWPNDCSITQKCPSWNKIWTDWIHK